jgi:MFS family permease
MCCAPPPRKKSEDDDNIVPTIITIEKNLATTTATSSELQSSLPSLLNDEETGRIYPTGLRLALILSSIYSVTILTAIDMNIIATAIPSITDTFGTVANVGWYATAFRLCYCAFQFLFGKAYTVFPAKKVFLTSNAIWLLGVSLCGAAKNDAMLVVGRAIAGLGTAGLTAGSAVVIVQAVPLHRRPMFQGFQAGIEGISVLAGPLLGGVLTQYVGWRWCFWINLPFGVVCLAFIFFCFVDNAPARHDHEDEGGFWRKLLALDFASNLLVIASLTCLFLALAWAGIEYAWNSATIIGLLVGFATLFIVFLAYQHHRDDAAVLPLRLFRTHSVVATLSYACLLNSAGNVLDYYLPTYFQAAHDYSPAQSGYLMIPIILGGTFGAIGQGVGTSITGQYGPFMLSASVSMCIATGLITTFVRDTSLAKLIAFTAWSGLSYGSGICTNPIALQAVLSEVDVPIAMSTLLFVESLGPAVAIAVAQVIFTNGLVHHLSGISGLGNFNIQETGLIQLVQDSPVGEREKVLVAIVQSMSPIWYLVLGLACATIFGAWFTEWRSIKKEEGLETM